MKRFAVVLIVAVPIALLCRALYLMFSAPPDAALLDHAYRSAAYTITWAIQLGYLSWLGLKWQAQKCAAERAGVLESSGKPSAS